MNEKTFDPVELFDAGGIFYLEDMPTNSEFGIDYQSWRIGEKFRGVKMIPPGVHFIYYSVVDKYGQLGMRSGFFYDFKLREALVMKWNQAAECVEDKRLTLGQMENFQSRRRELDPFLGAYPFDVYKRWVSLTNHIGAGLIKSLMPKTGFITSEACLIGKSFITKQSQKMEQDHTATSSKSQDIEKKIFDTSVLEVPTDLRDAEKKLPEMRPDENSVVNFTKITSQRYPEGSNPDQITKYSIDLSFKLDLFFKEQQKNIEETSPTNQENLLGELQFAFICFLIGNVYDGFEQWKSMVNLVCNSEEAVRLHPEFYISLVNTLYYQLNEMPLDFFTDITTSDNFLVVQLHNLFDNIRDVASDSNSSESIVKLHKRCEQFKNYLQQKFNFDFDEEPDEYAPVICDEESTVN